MNYKVIASSSSGNCVCINDNVLVDLEISYKKLISQVKPKNINCIFYTHIHGDHFKLPTLKLLLEENKYIKVFCNSDISKVLEKSNIPHYKVNLHSSISVLLNDGKKLTVTMEKMTHDVLTFGFKMHFKSMLGNVNKVFYATDTGNLDGIKAIGYDLYFIESNYRYKNLCSFDALRVIQTHLSDEQCDSWYVLNKKESSKIVRLHRSSRNW